jgi:hypothetical protein
MPIALNGTRLPFAPGTSTVHLTVMRVPALTLPGSGVSRWACAPCFAAAGAAAARVQQ